MATISGEKTAQLSYELFTDSLEGKVTLVINGCYYKIMELCESGKVFASMLHSEQCVGIICK